MKRAAVDTDGRALHSVLDGVIRAGLMFRNSLGTNDLVQYVQILEKKTLPRKPSCHMLLQKRRVVIIWFKKAN